ncbi:mannosyltransferase [Amanita muscaria]
MLLILLLLIPVFVLCARRLRRNNASRKKALIQSLGGVGDKPIVGFFHPYCNAGGGGERVLWTAIAAIQRARPDIISVVYSGDTETTKASILAKVQGRFNIQLRPSRLHFVFLESRYLVEDSTWPKFTLLGQSLGSMCLAWEAMSKLIPDLFIDTMGYAFAFHVVAALGNVPIGAYVHYPTISTDMLARVKSRKRWHTNADSISSSTLLSKGKLLYYRLFMYYYAWSLSRARFLMVNSTWTKNHVDSILQHTDRILDLLHVYPMLTFLHDKPPIARIVYPPCDTAAMSNFPLRGRERVILSVAQFRPEKDHAVQLHSFHKLLQTHPEYAGSDTERVRLVLVGGSRNAGDAARVDSLLKLAQELGLTDHIAFVINASYPVVLDWLRRSSIGLSTMVDEHFGINVVEFMAAGMIPVAHASGGPLMDIVVPYEGGPTGFHARDSDSFAEALHNALSLSNAEELAMRERARKWAVQRFSEEEFVKGWDSSGWLSWLPKNL